MSQGSAAYKVNKKKKLIQVTGFQGADKGIAKAVKKATKGASGLPFEYVPYCVKDADEVVPKFKNDELRSVKVRIGGKLYKAKSDEYDYDKEGKAITFKGPNLGGSWTVK